MLFLSYVSASSLVFRPCISLLVTKHFKYQSLKLVKGSKTCYQKRLFPLIFDFVIPIKIFLREFTITFREKSQRHQNGVTQPTNQFQVSVNFPTSFCQGVFFCRCQVEGGGGEGKTAATGIRTRHLLLSSPVTLSLGHDVSCCFCSSSLGHEVSSCCSLVGRDVFCFQSSSLGHDASC